MLPHTDTEWPDIGLRICRRLLVCLGSGAGGPNLLYKFDLDGNYVGSLTQPSTSVFGWYDLAWDGQYLYGGQDGSATITGIDLNGTVQATIPSPS